MSQRPLSLGNNEEVPHVTKSPRKLTEEPRICARESQVATDDSWSINYTPQDKNKQKTENSIKCTQI